LPTYAELQGLRDFSFLPASHPEEPVVRTTERADAAPAMTNEYALARVI